MASAVLTQESMPPLRRTMADALAFDGMWINYSVAGIASQDQASDALGGGMPDEFVELQAEPDGEIVGEDPFDQLLWIEPLPFSFRVVEHRREQYLANAVGELMFLRKFAREFVVLARRNHEFHFVVVAEQIEISILKRIRRAGIGALHIDDFDDVFGQFADESLAAGFDHHRVAIAQ